MPTLIQTEWFDTRVLRFLCEAKMETLEEVADRPAYEWLRMPGCGRKTVRDIQEVLHEHGLSFKGGDYNPRDGYVDAGRRFLSAHKVKTAATRIQELEDALMHIGRVIKIRMYHGRTEPFLMDIERTVRTAIGNSADDI